jgi:hypothetical protein
MLDGLLQARRLRLGRITSGLFGVIMVVKVFGANTNHLLVNPTWFKVPTGVNSCLERLVFFAELQKRISLLKRDGGEKKKS